MYWMTLPVKRYFKMSGRSRRKEYWMFWLFTILVGIVAGLLDTLLGFGSLETTSSSARWSTSGPLSSLTSLFFFIPSITVAVRRLHDTDRSAWWLLLVFIPILGWIALFVFMVLDGTRGDNRFGPDPKDPAGENDAQEVFG